MRLSFAKGTTTPPYPTPPTKPLLPALNRRKLAATFIVTIFSGAVGLIFLFIIAATCCYCAIRLGDCWVIIIERWPEYDKYVRDPYPLIAEICYGPSIRLLGIIGSLSIVIPLAMIIWIIVFDPDQIITHGDNISLITWESISFAYGIIVFIFASIPIYPSLQIDMKNPEKFGRSLIYASIESVPRTKFQVQKFGPASCNLRFADDVVLFSESPQELQLMVEELRTASSKVGLEINLIASVMIFSFGFICYSLIQEKLSTNIILSLKEGTLTQIINVLLLVHVFTQALLSINPVNQSIEELLGISSDLSYMIDLGVESYIFEYVESEFRTLELVRHFLVPYFKHGITMEEEEELALYQSINQEDFIWKRIFSRIIVLAFLTFIAVTFTQFVYIMNILGASTLVILAFACPLSFYLKLTSMKAPERQKWPNWKVSRLEKFFMLVIIIVTSIGGVVSIYNAFNEISKVSKFEIPCYLNFS
ncbi:hypothetical protein GQR58_022890 [Nymphon striatum]|nr:hypothetical protein GQR58_022890 [Nymphon striatum]